MFKITGEEKFSGKMCLFVFFFPEHLCNPLGFSLNGRTVTISLLSGNFLYMLQQPSGNGKMRNKSIALYTFMLTVSHSR